MEFAITGLGDLELLTPERIWSFFWALVTLILGVLLARLFAGLVVRIARKRVDAQQLMLIRRLVFYPLLVIVLLSVLNQLGLKLGVLLGAAGILTVALGFASQTSASNLISGLFLIIEKPFVLGDIVKIGEAIGEVLSVDLLSVKLRTFDNLFVRVPNEEIIKTQLTNLTHFPIRRVDLQIGVAYREDLRKVRSVLDGLADRNPLCLDQPAPLYIFKGFGDSALEMQFSVWAKRENFLELRNAIQFEIKEAFDAADIEIPFPHRTLYTGSRTEPFPVRVVSDENREG